MILDQKTKDIIINMSVRQTFYVDNVVEITNLLAENTHIFYYDDDTLYGIDAKTSELRRIKVSYDVADLIHNSLISINMRELEDDRLRGYLSKFK